MKPYGSGAIRSGTAFFISPTRLLTAGHLVHDARDKIVAEEPGQLKATYFIRQLFRDTNTNFKFECKLITTLFGTADVSILEVVDSYQSVNFIQVDQMILPPDCDGVAVDILGYPGAYGARDIEVMHPTDEADFNLVKDVESLFPRRELVISHGIIKNGGTAPRYRVSTIIGMSGGPVLVNGKVIGTNPCLSTLY